ncbi:27308_t:CDS:2, partial [Dentiscutata erythropus]
PEIEEKNLRGLYFEPFGEVGEPTTRGKDEELAKKLWGFSENFVKEKLALKRIELQISCTLLESSSFFEWGAKTLLALNFRNFSKHWDSPALPGNLVIPDGMLLNNTA